ncbi:MAG: ABC transporter permease [Candidatus Heimdallarchaeota archaeon]|nr:ABC transporter permease [Candidatus Heimdallarchaeota archaeon]
MFGQVLLKTVKQLLRNKGRIAVIIGTPILFLGFFGIIFAPMSGENIIYYGYINQDLGLDIEYYSYLPLSYDLKENPKNLGTLFINTMSSNMSALTDSASSIKLEFIAYDTRAALIEDLQDQSILMAFIIPDNFTEVTMATFNTHYRAENGVYAGELPRSGGNTSITVLGDVTSSNYQVSFSIFNNAFSSFVEGIYGVDVFEELLYDGDLTFQHINLGVSVSDYQYFAAGFVVFIVLMNMVNVASILADEKEKGTINRIKMSMMPSWQLFLAVIIVQIVVVFIQMVIATGFLILNDVHLTIDAWFRSLLILQITNVNVTGLGLIVASFAKTQKDAASITSILAAPLGFLSGSFVPLPESYLIKSINLKVWDVIPSYHSVQSLQRIFLFNTPLTELLYPIMMLSLFSIIWLGIGLLVYNRRVIHSDT